MHPTHRTLGRFTVLAALLAMGAALDIAWKDLEKGREAMQDKKRPGLVFFAGDEGDAFAKKAEEELFSSKVFLSRIKKVVPIRIEGDAEEELREEHGAPAGAGSLLVLDVTGERLGLFTGDFDVETVTETLKKAVEVSEEKGKVLESVEKAFENGEKGLKKKNYAKALQGFLLVLQIQEQKGEEVKSPLYEEAQLKVDEIRAEADKILNEAEALVEKKQYAKAKNIAADVARRFPDEQVQSRAKGVQDMIEAKLREQYGGGK